MTDFNDRLKEAMRDYLVRIGYDAVEVTDYDQREESSGYCETCWYETTMVCMTYIDSEGNSNQTNYYGDLGELIRELT